MFYMFSNFNFETYVWETRKSYTKFGLVNIEDAALAQFCVSLKTADQKLSTIISDTSRLLLISLHV